MIERVPMSEAQAGAVAHCLKGEERAYFVEILDRLQKTFDEMPKLYEQDGRGDDAIAHLHYFAGGCDWWITEKAAQKGHGDSFGFACLNGDTVNAELGYINLHELRDAGAELDFHYEPTTLREIKRGLGIAADG